MAEYVVSSALEMFTIMLARQPEIGYGALGHQIQNLKTELENLLPLLVDADARQSSIRDLKSGLARIREATYKAVDVVEAFSLMLNARFTSISSRAKISEIKSEVEGIAVQISEMTTSLQRWGVKALSERDRTSKRQRKVRETYFNFGEHQIVGLDSHVHQLSSLLLKEDSDCRVITIYDHDVKHVLRSILIQLTSSTTELGVAAPEMATEIIRVLHTKRCLVVLDDVRDAGIFPYLRRQDISTATNSKVIVTTRNEKLAHGYLSSCLYEHCCLDDESSWQLFHRIAISKRDKTDIEDKMINMGMEITILCEGMPLLVSLLAGLLSTKFTLEEWEAVLEKILGLGVVEGRDDWLLGLIYDDLPYYLKPCFLYFSQFPEDLEIPVKRLIQMWIADGVISTMAHEKDGHMETMEDVAYRYLSELAERYMVLSGERGSIGKIKTCKMHDLLLDLATFKAQQENFFDRSPPYAPRVSISMVKYVDNMQELTQLNPRIRSLIYVLPISQSSPLSIRFVVKRLKFLRVLCMENFTSTGGILTEDIGDLILLRFLSLKNSDISKLPPSIFYLRYLQTLDLRTSAASLKIPNVMWRTENLRHLYMHPAYSLKGGGKLKLGHLGNLQTLVNINDMDLDLEDVVQLGSPRKLVIIIRNMQRGFVTTGGFGEIFKFKDNTLSRLQSLGILNLTSTNAEIRPLLSRCYAINKMWLQGRITKLSECHQLSFNLAKLIIKGTFLEDDPMATLEKLPKLCVLCLGLETFMGYKLICSQRGFPQLQILRLHGLHNLEELGAENGAMPLLSHLDIRDCPNLNVIPDKVRHLTTFQNQI